MTDLKRAQSDDPADWLGATRLVNKDHPAVRETVARLTSSLTTPSGKARALFDFVSKEIRFGFSRGFWDNTADQVLENRRGFCNTKGTLFVALLRAAEIPARQVFVDIDTRVLSGIIDPGTPYLDHSYTEAFLDGQWRATDAYIVDPPLFQASHRMLSKSGESFGFGIHIDGSTEWDTENPSFSQFPLPVDEESPGRVHGPFVDLEQFYATVPNTWNRLNGFSRAMMGILASGANRRAEQLRRSNK